MQVGSLVICINNDTQRTEASRIMAQKGYVFPNKESIYIIRGFQPRIVSSDDSHNIYLEEIVNPPIELMWRAYQNKITNIEMGFGIDRFKEIQPPMDLTEIIEAQHEHHQEVRKPETCRV